MKKTKKYRVIIDKRWSEEFFVKAQTVTEAKNNAWEKYKKKIKRKEFVFYVDKWES